MASRLIEDYFPKTAEYINSSEVSEERAGHHNYVIEQKVLNLVVPLANMKESEVKKLDDEFLEYLRELDVPIG